MTPPSFRIHPGLTRVSESVAVVSRSMESTRESRGSGRSHQTHKSVSVCCEFVNTRSIVNARRLRVNDEFGDVLCRPERPLANDNGDSDLSFSCDPLRSMIAHSLYNCSQCLIMYSGHYRTLR